MLNGDLNWWTCRTCTADDCNLHFPLPYSNNWWRVLLIILVCVQHYCIGGEFSTKEVKNVCRNFESMCAPCHAKSSWSEIFFDEAFLYMHQKWRNFIQAREDKLWPHKSYLYGCSILVPRWYDLTGRSCVARGEWYIFTWGWWLIILKGILTESA